MGRAVARPLFFILYGLNLMLSAVFLRTAYILIIAKYWGIENHQGNLILSRLDKQIKTDFIVKKTKRIAIYSVLYYNVIMPTDRSVGG